jgi:predicted phage tail component-like protein
MAEIIWKNKSSKEIEGLIITETPPITKPKMKVNKIEIDGRDGDIIEKVGYESYTKNIGIGLTRNFNIDEVIKYFTGDGELIISDEPNKVYIASIYEDVDYEKFLTMKKATIKYHVQPYKYLKNEAKAELSVSTQKSIEVTNKGLEISKPIIKLIGSGTIEVAINNSTFFIYKFPDDENEVTIDSQEEEAYLDGIYKNRNMTGIFPLLEPGKNSISWSGDLSKIIIEPKK